MFYASSIFSPFISVPFHFTFVGSALTAAPSFLAWDSHAKEEEKERGGKRG